MKYFNGFGLVDSVVYIMFLESEGWTSHWIIQSVFPSPEGASSQAFSWFQPARGRETLSLLASVSEPDGCSGHGAGCLTGGCDQSGAAGRKPGEVFSSCLPLWHLPGWNRGGCPKAVHVFRWGRGLRSNFCVCLLRSFTVPQTICELLFGNICFRTVIEFTSGCTLCGPRPGEACFFLLTWVVWVAGQKCLHLLLFNLLFLEEQSLWEGSHVAK